MADSNAPRCPLGFTGTPPVGHPSIPGFGGGSGSGSADAKAGVGRGAETSSRLAAALEAYRPSTLLVIDALFLGICIVAAIYRDDIKAYWLGSGSNLPAGVSASNAAGAKSR